MSANAWMQTPAGGVFQNGRYLVTDNLAVIFNPDMPWAVSHMWFACLEISLFVIGGISAWYLLKNRQVDFFLKSFKIAVVAAVIVTSLQIYLGTDQEGNWLKRSPPSWAPWKPTGRPIRRGKERRGICWHGRINPARKMPGRSASPMS